MKKLILSIVILLSILPTHAMEKKKKAKPKGQDTEQKGGGISKEAETQDNEKESQGDSNGESETTGGVLAARFPQVHFSPGIKEVLIELIRKEQKRMRGAWYRFTLYEPAQAIVKRIKKKGVLVSLILDQGQFGNNTPKYPGDFCEGLKIVVEAGGKVYKKTEMRNEENEGNFEIMHHKFMIFDENVGGKKLLWTGSFNATGQADLKNCENVVILDDERAIARFESEYAELVKLSRLLTAAGCTSRKTGEVAEVARRMNGIPSQEAPTKRLARRIN